MALFSGITDALFGSGGADDSQAAVNTYNNLAPPTTDQEKILLQQYVDQGQLTPEQAQAALVNSNAYDSMNLDSTGKEAQIQALQSLQNIGNNGGLTDSDKAQLQDIQNQQNTNARGARDAVIQSADARGAGGSGLSELAQLQANQDAASNASTQDLAVAGQGQARALAALEAAGTQGGALNQQQFAQQQAIANSQNAIAQFNAQNTQQTNLTNTAADNAAAAANLSNKQNVANANTGVANQQEVANQGLAQQNYEDSLQKANGQAGAYTSAANNANTDRSQDMSLIGTLGSAAATGFSSPTKAATSVTSDEREKKDIAQFDAGDFLDSLTGYKYKYKDPSNGPGKQIGVMAQDVEKEAPQMVEDTPSGKILDFSMDKAGGPILASLAHINERLKGLEGKKNGA